MGTPVFRGPIPANSPPERCHLSSSLCPDDSAFPPALCSVSFSDPEGYIDSSDYPPLPLNNFLECTYNATVYTGYGVELQVTPRGCPALAASSSRRSPLKGHLSQAYFHLNQFGSLFALTGAS